ncbi:excinuclease ABC subunit UvrC [Legionella taurinensis]|uniref:UvrABC system protein C n=1 Tax=Legionella taurinensis TaxID=70611 RepID=A0AB38N4U5_9GAMM|nr:excinuclease ABC subunit UvrC [Legionella taurinensis]MDX1837456.1 excinuclease ABC subunit UvrC [Legionella taurinensis]PUT40801.1 excinuclease ABC subunit C [Legionella taurinensis]PUT44222.1 excinuclease ABC subunit C [Legionella taurinensis]PUT47524.1 excinuclease ABC subunit C [Legionella taurinensis]PUT48663.1 excinuclease ABC subunit C [Legionella taurinensis]
MNEFLPSPELTALLANLTSEPGVYRMMDVEDTILYVGKASNLKKRVSSYFSKQTTGAKTRSLVSQIARIEVSVTRSETEALLLESNLIKSLRPKYNVLLRDDKSYPYIHVVRSNGYPRMELYRSKKKPQKGDFFGPYPSATAVRETLNSIQKVFKIRNCRDSYFSTRSRPCLQYQIKRCTAPCTGYISEAEYQQAVDDALRFLQGKSQAILEEMGARMEDAVKRLAFEEAALLRDQIKSLRLVQEQQGVVQLRGDADVIVMDAKPGFACIQCVTVRDGHVLASQSFFPSVPQRVLVVEEEPRDLRQQVLEAFVSFYYVDAPERIPGLLILAEPLPELEAIRLMLSELRGKECQIQINPRGIKARWLDFAVNNLRLAVSEYDASRLTMKNRYEALAAFLRCPAPIARMECFDISHTQGEATIASCVVFDTEGPRKKDYRRFNITGITAGDDYAAMQQVLTRRFKRLREEQHFPDILIIDGGKGQVNVAQKVLTDLGVEGVFLLGIAKGPDRKAGLERLILVARNEEIMLPEDSPALHLLQHIRDEAHRFAITAHRKKRQTARLESSLETIEGVGPKRRQALLRRFGGLRELAKAPLAEIAKVTGINDQLALRIFRHFRDD